MDNPLHKLPKPLRRLLVFVLRAAVTAGAFYLILSHGVVNEHGERMPMVQVLTKQLAAVDPYVLVPFLLLATAIKFVGILASMVRWRLLLIGQGIRFPLWHVVGSFLIGRFLGTFLPGTLGLDGYKLYDAARFSGRVVEPTAATVVEKAMGFSGIFLCFLVALPLGVQVFGDSAAIVLFVAVPVAAAVVVGFLALLLRPALIEHLVGLVPSVGFGRGRLVSVAGRASAAVAAYRGKVALLIAVSALSFVVHFCTAAMYFFTARAVGAANADFWQVTLASTVQILATVISPFTIAGEGVREIVQALLLAKHIGVGESVLSAALGFWAAEALTLVGAFFWWARREDYRPEVTLTNRVPAEPPCIRRSMALPSRQCRMNRNEAVPLPLLVPVPVT